MKITKHFSSAILKSLLPSRFRASSTTLSKRSSHPTLKKRAASFTRPLYAELQRKNPVRKTSSQSLYLTASKDRLVLIFLNALLLLNILIGFSFNFLQIQNILGFPILILVPGIMVYLLLRLKPKNFWESLIYISGLGILFLMSVGLLVNTLLPHFGILRPLDKWPMLISFDIATAGLIALFAFFGKFTSKKYHLPHIEYWPALLALAGPVLVLLSVLGAIQLNNGTDVYPTMVMLSLAVGILALLIGLANRVSQNLLLWTLYCIALSFLLMTSLRGWYTTGHDIQREFHVFELTKVSGSWDVSRFRDAYNACLSITILPTEFANLLQVSDNFIYKTLFQIIFALVPVAVFLIARRFVAAPLAVLTYIYFVSFPTFFSDMPFLNRQEIAFLFLAIMLLIIFEARLGSGKRKLLFLIFATGLIFSHYSTTYITIGILALAWITRVVLTRFRFRGSLRKLLSRSALIELRPLKSYRHLVTLPIVIMVALGSFVWSSVLTDTSHGLTSILTETVFSAKKGFAEDAKSSDVLYSLFSFQSADLQKQLTDYYTKATKDTLKLSHPEDFYAPSTYAGYHTTVVHDQLLPLTNIGQAVNKIFSVEKLNSLFRAFQARILQLFILIGLIFLLFRRSFTKKISTEYLAFSIGSGLIVMAVVVLPFLSVEYGLLRAFQQALMVLGIFIVIGSLAIIPGRYVYKLLFASSVAIIMMLSGIGLIPQLLGGYYPQLHLNNAGTYYDVFYTHRSEIMGIDWLQKLISSHDNLEVQSEVQTDRFAVGRVTNPGEVNLLNDIYPSLVRKNSYVYLGYSNVVLKEAAVSYNGNTILYTYPLEFLDQNKDLVYNNGGSRIYR